MEAFPLIPWHDEQFDIKISRPRGSFDEFEAMKGHNSIASKIAEDRSAGNNPLARFVWIPLGLKLSEEKKLAYESLKRDYDALHGAELIQAPLETLKTLIYNEISSKAHRRPNRVFFYKLALWFGSSACCARVCARALCMYVCVVIAFHK